MAVTVIDRPGRPEIIFEVNEVMRLTPLDCNPEDLLPHRGDWLLVSRVLYFDFEAGVVIINYDVPESPSWLDEHFPGVPIMPGFLVAEHGAQSGVVFTRLGGIQGLPYLARADGFKFQKAVYPGDKLYTKMKVDKWNGEVDRKVWHFNFLVKNQFSENIATGLITGVSHC